MRLNYARTLNTLRLYDDRDPPGVSLALAELALGPNAGVWLNDLCPQVTGQPYGIMDRGWVCTWHTRGGPIRDDGSHPPPIVTWRTTAKGRAALEQWELEQQSPPPPVLPIPPIPPSEPDEPVRPGI